MGGTPVTGLQQVIAPDGVAAGRGYSQVVSGRGRLVVKDAIMMGAAIVTMADSAKAYLRRTSRATTDAGAPRRAAGESPVIPSGARDLGVM